MSEELKPCPFCGSDKTQTVILGGLFRTSCGKCGASGGLCKTELESITAWNTRQPDTELVAALEKIEGILEKIDFNECVQDPCEVMDLIGDAEALTMEALSKHKEVKSSTAHIVDVDEKVCECKADIYDAIDTNLWNFCPYCGLEILEVK